MRSGLKLAAIAAGVLSAVGIAFAAEQVNLTHQQQQTIAQNLSSKPSESAPATFQPSVGAKVPSSIQLSALPSNIKSQMPASAKNLEYAKLQKKILLVDPSDRQVAAIVNESASTTGSGSALPSANENVPNSPK